MIDGSSVLLALAVYTAVVLGGGFILGRIFFRADSYQAIKGQIVVAIIMMFLFENLVGVFS